MKKGWSFPLVRYLLKHNFFAFSSKYGLNFTNRIFVVFIEQSLLLIKSGLGFQCLQLTGRVAICMIPFWVRLLIRIVCTLVLLVWVPFDKI